MKKYYFTIYPYATVHGSIEVEDDVEVDEDYIYDHLDDASLDDPDLEYDENNIENIEEE